MTDINLRKLTYSPHENPLLHAASVPTKRKRVYSALAERRLIDADTGELTHCATIYQIEEVDTEHFVKIYTAGIAASYELSKTAQKTFCAILAEYEQQPMSNGYAESVQLAWFDNGLCGKAIDLPERTFRRGLVELLRKKFLAPKSPHTYWVNPALFFKGDRVQFVNEYRRKDARKRQDPNTITLEAKEKAISL